MSPDLSGSKGCAPTYPAMLPMGCLWDQLVEMFTLRQLKIKVWNPGLGMNEQVTEGWKWPLS